LILYISLVVWIKEDFLTCKTSLGFFLETLIFSQTDWEETVVNFECVAKTKDDATNTEIKDTVAYKIEIDDKGLHVKVEYEQDIETQEMKTKSETQFKVLFHHIIEYSKIGLLKGGCASKAYEWDIDKVVQSIDLTTWDLFSEIVDEDTNSMLSSFSIMTQDGTAYFKFTEDHVTTNTLLMFASQISPGPATTQTSHCSVRSLQ
jgi:hypothetical protein